MPKNQRSDKKEFAGHFVVASSHGVREDYSFVQQIGCGSSAKVFLVESAHTGERSACKVMKKSLFRGSQTFLTEVDVHKTLSHPNVIQLERVYESPEKLYMVMEYASGGTLIDAICMEFKNGMPEKLAATIVADICEGLEYLHGNGVVHRDIKPDNVMLNMGRLSHEVSAALADFGFAGVLKSETHLFHRVGTPQYVAPEILKSEGHGASADMWSLGVLVYVVLTGRMPFFGANTSEMYERIKAGKFSFHEQLFSGISQDAMDLISRLLRVEPEARPSASDVLRHAWFSVCGRQRRVLSRRKVRAQVQLDRVERRMDLTGPRSAPAILTDTSGSSDDEPVEDSVEVMTPHTPSCALEARMELVPNSQTEC